jgi:hypothetical protein
MNVATIALAAGMLASATPAFAERANETKKGRARAEVASASAFGGVETAVRRALESLGRLRFHPGRDANDGARTVTRARQAD